MIGVNMVKVCCMCFEILKEFIKNTKFKNKCSGNVKRSNMKLEDIEQRPIHIQGMWLCHPHWVSHTEGAKGAPCNSLWSQELAFWVGSSDMSHCVVYPQIHRFQKPCLYLRPRTFPKNKFAERIAYSYKDGVFFHCFMSSSCRALGGCSKSNTC